jgi:hypothetical protein
MHERSSMNDAKEYIEIPNPGRPPWLPNALSFCELITRSADFLSAHAAVADSLLLRVSSVPR